MSNLSISIRLNLRRPISYVWFYIGVHQQQTNRTIQGEIKQEGHKDTGKLD